MHANGRTVAARAPVEAAEVPRATANPRPLLVLLRTLERRYQDLTFHGERVARYCEATARTLGMPTTTVERLRLAGMLHDVGKVGVPEAVLEKPEPLTAGEWSEVKRHPEIGANLLAASNLDDVSRWVVAHHERPDGTGYPYGLEDRETPTEAKVLAVTDAYDAMRSHRVYRAALDHSEASAELRRGAGTQFDPGVVDAFLGSAVA